MSSSYFDSCLFVACENITKMSAPFLGGRVLTKNLMIMIKKFWWIS